MKYLNKIAAGGLGLLLTAALVPPAMALPPGGASPNTPGTSSAVTPSTVAACDMITWEVWGFAPNELVQVKFDDGMLSGGDMSVQGQGVVSTAMADSTGYATNSVDVPCDFPAGDHWLRFLATERLNDDGEVRGYTNRSPDFTVTAAASNTGGSGGGGGGTAGTGGNTSGGTSGGGTSGGNTSRSTGGGGSQGGGGGQAVIGGGGSGGGGGQ